MMAAETMGGPADQYHTAEDTEEDGANDAGLDGIGVVSMAIHLREPDRPENR